MVEDHIYVITSVVSFHYNLEVVHTLLNVIDRT